MPERMFLAVSAAPGAVGGAAGAEAELRPNMEPPLLPMAGLEARAVRILVVVVAVRDRPTEGMREPMVPRPLPGGIPAPEAGAEYIGPPRAFSLAMLEVGPVAGGPETLAGAGQVVTQPEATAAAAS